MFWHNEAEVKICLVDLHIGKYRIKIKSKQYSNLDSTSNKMIYKELKSENILLESIKILKLKFVRLR